MVDRPGLQVRSDMRNNFSISKRRWVGGDNGVHGDRCAIGAGRGVWCRTASALMSLACAFSSRFTLFVAPPSLMSGFRLTGARPTTVFGRFGDLLVYGATCPPCPVRLIAVLDDLVTPTAGGLAGQGWVKTCPSGRAYGATVRPGWDVGMVTPRMNDSPAASMAFWLA